MQRFNHDAVTDEEIRTYIHSRALQLLSDSVELLALSLTDYGAHSHWKHNDKEYDSFYLKPNFRGKGLYQELVKNSCPILTIPDCDIEYYLQRYKIPHVVLGQFLLTPEYKIISSFYGDKTTTRSGSFLMNHIDEGLAVLSWIGASDVAKKAYCLHPLFQSDADLLNNFGTALSDLDPHALLFAIEYRSVANEYLSTRKISSIDEIRLSPLKEVNEMLIADKIQNYKDFLIYHKDTHPRAKELDKYFKNWLAKLKINYFEEYSKRLTVSL